MSASETTQDPLALTLYDTIQICYDPYYNIHQSCRLLCMPYILDIMEGVMLNPLPDTSTSGQMHSSIPCGDMTCLP
ncbi:unnamed protein product [Strongylus vulgaris]|uniref:Uncharacterized protein n=1 Tax=Strongylus vulgaris TaxID=40348 RepID=A0A3P7JL95_STRVU|nr:unnamed protein product [Strongylus vulgaris]